MIPRILEYENGRITVTSEAYMLPELKAIIDKYETQAEPYLAYVHLMTYPASPYVNLPDSEKKENVIYDIIQSISDFDIDEPLLDIAIRKLDSLFMTRTRRYFNNLCKLMDGMEAYSENRVITDENLSDITKTLKDAALTMKSFKEAEKQIDEELKTKMRGKSQLGEY